MGAHEAAAPGPGRPAQACGGRARGALDREFCYNRTNTLLETAVQNLTAHNPGLQEARAKGKTLNNFVNNSLKMIETQQNSTCSTFLIIMPINSTMSEALNFKGPGGSEGCSPGLSQRMEGKAM